MKRAPLALLVLLGIGCHGDDPVRQFPGRPDIKDRFVWPEKQTDFWKLYNQNCRGCHGADGTLGPAPPLRDAIFLTIASTAELLDTVSEGRAGTSMPGFSKGHGGTLTDEQMQILVKGLGQELWGKAFTPPAGDWPPYAPPAEKGDVARGKTVFAAACASCHGDNGTGTITMGPINDRSFLALSSEQFLRRIVITGRPDLGMPNCHEKTGREDNFAPLTNADVNDVTALLLSWKISAK